MGDSLGRVQIPYSAFSDPGENISSVFHNQFHKPLNSAEFCPWFLGSLGSAALSLRRCWVRDLSRNASIRAGDAKEAGSPSRWAKRPGPWQPYSQARFCMSAAGLPRRVWAQGGVLFPPGPLSGCPLSTLAALGTGPQVCASLLCSPHPCSQVAFLCSSYLPVFFFAAPARSPALVFLFPRGALQFPPSVWTEVQRRLSLRCRRSGFYCLSYYSFSLLGKPGEEENPRRELALSFVVGIRSEKQGTGFKELGQ